jgi:hypothetical protein
MLPKSILGGNSLDLELMAWMGPGEAWDSLIPAGSHKVFICNAFARFYKFFLEKKSTIGVFRPPNTYKRRCAQKITFGF